MLRISLIENKKLDEPLRKISMAIRETALETFEETVSKAEAMAREQALDPLRKPKPGKGNFAGSIHSTHQRDGLQVEGTLASALPYAPILEFGARPHVITPVKGKALAWPGAKHPVKKINHPGSPPYRVLSNAVHRAVESLEELLAKNLERNLK